MLIFQMDTISVSLSPDKPMEREDGQRDLDNLPLTGHSLTRKRKCFFADSKGRFPEECSAVPVPSALSSLSLLPCLSLIPKNQLEVVINYNLLQVKDHKRNAENWFRKAFVCVCEGINDEFS